MRCDAAACSCIKGQISCRSITHSDCARSHLSENAVVAVCGVFSAKVTSHFCPVAVGAAAPRLTWPSLEPLNLKAPLSVVASRPWAEL